MGCSGCKPTRTATRAVWTDKTTTAQFLPFFSLAIAEVSRAKMDLLVESIDQAISVTRAVRYSNDGGVTWTSATEVGSAVTTEGWSNDTSYNALDDDYQIAQVGLNVKNTSGTALNVAQVTFRLATTAAQR